MARFYVMPVQADLLAGWTLVREWGWAESQGTCGINHHLTKLAYRINQEINGALSFRKWRLIAFP